MVKKLHRYIGRGRSPSPPAEGGEEGKTASDFQSPTKIQIKMKTNSKTKTPTQSQRDCVLQPRVATAAPQQREGGSSELPWVNDSKTFSTLKGLQHRGDFLARKSDASFSHAPCLRKVRSDQLRSFGVDDREGISGKESQRKIC